MAKKRGNGEGSIAKRTDGRWMASLTIGRDPQTGKLRRASLYGKTRQEVATKLAQALRDKSHGVFVAPHRMTVSEWLQIWLHDYKRPAVRPKTFESYEQQIRLHITPALGHIPLTDLRPHHLQHFYNTLHQQVSACTVRHNHAILRQALALAEQHQRLAHNPAPLCTLPRIVVPERTTLAVTQVTQALFPALEGHRLGAAIVVACGTGLRRGEVLGVRWADIDLQRSLLSVRQIAVRLRLPFGQKRLTQIVMREPKTPQSRRTIPLPAVCVQALRQHKARQAQERLLCGNAYTDLDLVFCREDGTALEAKTFNRALARVLRQTGLPHVRFHDLRHTFATWMLEQGEHPKTVSVLLGHTKVGITLDLYSHVSLELEQQAIQRLNRTLEGPF